MSGFTKVYNYCPWSERSGSKVSTTYEKVGSVYVVPYAKFFVYCLSKKPTSLLMFYIKIKIANLHV